MMTAISDIQALLCYVFDSLLMRQLLREYTEQREAMVRIQSRCISHRRMLLEVQTKLSAAEIEHISNCCSQEVLQPLEQGVCAQTPFARCIIFTAKGFGHIITVGMYWVCICVWLGFGPRCHWSNRWQLYINDATSALMVLIFAFLACLRECYADYTNTCLDAIFHLNCALERGLRLLTEDEAPNLIEADMPLRDNYLQKAIYYYADVIGTLAGMILLIVVLVTWASLGPILHFSNTWWLLIGTYAGLVGLFDSFVLRNVQSKVHKSHKAFVRRIEELDDALFTGLSLSVPTEQNTKAPSLARRVSRKMDAISSHLLMVVAGFLFTIGCLAASSAMHWSLTGQLISNVPPSVIETFFILILITGQNDAEAGARVDLTNIYYRRQQLLSFLRHAAEYYEEQERGMPETETGSGAEAVPAGNQI